MIAEIDGPQLSIATRTVGAVDIVSIGGEVDINTASQLSVSLLSLIAAGHTRLVLDLSDVSFIDSAGLGVLISAQRRLRALDGSLDVVTARPLVQKMFHITALDRVFGVHSTVDEALACHPQGLLSP